MLPVWSPLTPQGEGGLATTVGMNVPAPHLAFSDNLLIRVLGYHVKSWQQRKYRLPNLTFAAWSGARDVFCLWCLVGEGLFSLPSILSSLVLWLETADFS